MKVVVIWSFRDSVENTATYTHVLPVKIDVPAWKRIRYQNFTSINFRSLKISIQNFPIPIFHRLKRIIELFVINI